MIASAQTQNHRLCFPNLGIAIEPCRIDGKHIRECVHAVESMASTTDVLDSRSVDHAGNGDSSEPDHLHRWNNLLNTAILTLDVLQLQVNEGRTAEAEETLKRAITALQGLDHWLDPLR